MQHLHIFNKYLRDGIVLIYGSRVEGTYTDTSDVDLIIKNSTLDRQQLKGVEIVRHLVIKSAG